MNPDSALLLSSGAQRATGQTTDDSPLIVDYTPQLTLGQVAVVSMVSFIGTLTQRAPDTRGVPPGSGLFLCPKGTPVETLAQAQAGINLDARPIAIPLSDEFLDVQIIGATPTYAVSMKMKPGTKIPIFADWFLRAIIVCQQGAATPGPGALSFGRLDLIMSVEGNCPCP